MMRFEIIRGTAVPHGRFAFGAELYHALLLPISLEKEPN